jgi:hypothetical protein
MATSANLQVQDPSGKTPSRIQYDQIALGAVWLAVVATVLVMLVGGVRATDEFQVVRHSLHAVYVAVLLWVVSRRGPVLPPSSSPEPRSSSGSTWRTWAPVVGVLLVLLLVSFSDDGVDIFMLLCLVVSLCVIVAWRRDITLRLIVQALVVAGIAFLCGLPVARNGFASLALVTVLPAMGVPMYVAGGLLVKQTRLGGLQLLQGRGWGAARSFLTGCLLFVPLGMINAAEGSPGTDITWVTEWWMPGTLPLFSGITEEIWFRLFLVGSCFFILRPVFQARPILAVVAAVLLSAVIFGLSHDRTLERLLTTGLLYGLPMAVVFVRWDWEHAVGAHYMINFIPWLTVFLEA